MLLLETTTEEVVFLVVFYGGIRLMIQIFQVIAAITILWRIPINEGVQRYALALLRTGHYRAVIEGSCQITFFVGRIEAKLSRQPNALIWVHKEKVVLTLSGDYPSWRDSDRFSLLWLENDAVSYPDRIYAAKVVPVFISALNKYYVVFYDQDGNYAGVILLVWHS